MPVSPWWQPRPVAAIARPGFAHDHQRRPQLHDFFSGLLVYDNFTIFLRLFLFGFTALIIWLSLLTGIPDREDSGRLLLPAASAPRSACR